MHSLARATISRSTFVTTAAATGALAVTGQRARAADTYLMKFGTATVNDTQHAWMKTFKGLIEQDSGGRIKVEIYPSSQLGSIPRMIEGVQFNSIQGFVGAPDFMTGIDPRYEVLGIPEVFKSDQNAFKTMADPAFRSAFLSLGADKGIIGVGLILDDAQSVVTRKPVENLAGLKGLKLRTTAGPVLAAMMSSIGATGVPMPLDQVLPAVQQGAIDGVLSSLAVLTPMKIYSSAPYAVAFTNAYTSSCAVISKQWYDTLSPDLQKMVIADAAKTDKLMVPVSEKFMADQRAAYVAGGGKIVKLSPADEAQLDALWAPIGKNNVADNPAVKSLYDVLIAAAARNR